MGLAIHSSIRLLNVVIDARFYPSRVFKKKPAVSFSIYLHIFSNRGSMADRWLLFIDGKRNVAIKSLAWKR